MDAWERLEVSEKSIQSASEALRITSALYKQGVAQIIVPSVDETPMEIDIGAAAFFSP